MPFRPKTAPVETTLTMLPLPLFLKDASDAFSAHARKPGQLSFPSSGFQRRDAGDSSVLPEHARFFGADAVDMQNVHHAGGDFGGQVLVKLQRASFEDFGNFLCDYFANAGDFF